MSISMNHQFVTSPSAADSTAARHPSKTVLRTLLLAALTAASLVGSTARADASCATFVKNAVYAVTGNNYPFYTFDMTIHRSDVHFVSYSSGSLQLSGNATWPLRGTSNQLFSDRLNGSQPFNINAADRLEPWISTTGALYLYSPTWKFSTQWDMSCTGNVMTKIIPGYGVVTLILRDLSQIIH